MKHRMIRFVIGREKDVENSEILRLIHQSLQMDQERNEMSRALQHHHQAYQERHLQDDGFSNLELNDHDETSSLTDPHPAIHIEEKNYDVRLFSVTMANEHVSSSLGNVASIQSECSRGKSSRKSI